MLANARSTGSPSSPHAPHSSCASTPYSTVRIVTPSSRPSSVPFSDTPVLTRSQHMRVREAAQVHKGFALLLSGISLRAQNDTQPVELLLLAADHLEVAI